MSLSITITNGTECYAPWICRDVNGVLYTPTSLTYTVWNLTGNVQVGTEQTLTPASTGTITLDSTVNTMDPASGAYEQRQVTLKVGVPGGTFRNDVAQYTLVASAGTP